MKITEIHTELTEKEKELSNRVDVINNQIYDLIDKRDTLKEDLCRIQNALTELDNIQEYTE